MKNYNRDILSIDSDDSDDDYVGFVQFLNEDTDRNKNKLISEIKNNGELLLNEIDRKKNVQNNGKSKYVKYIIKHSKSYTSDELMHYEIKDIIEIYTELKNNKIGKISRIFKFLFNQ